MKALPLEAVVGGTASAVFMILLTAITFVVVVWVMANHYQKTHPSIETGTEPRNL